MTQNKQLKTKSFRFKQFSIEGGSAGMAVSTDGVLLGAWSQCHSSGEILDIGTGTGLLSLMIAQRYPEKKIVAIDIDPHAFEAARHNVHTSAWAERICVELAPLEQYALSQSGKLFSDIICNPPYFNSGETAQSLQRATARHTQQLSHEALARDISHLLHHNGKASLILPVVEGEQFLLLAQRHHLHASRLCYVHPTNTKPASRLLIELKHQANECENSALTIMQDGTYSAEFTQLTREFYLKM
ncbi:tRNA1(Val) (adenine(37)-N6)-methyltransferase [Vibrio astriarenae]|uniref:tRNA1(Val) (adenine(37)-N6)-methyltransferase n=1 Tax=Vibrio astriarenae TaxID=1481923 RepID=UPI003735A234